jgi:uracil-DNA glycosylase
MFAQRNPGGPKKGDTKEDRLRWFEDCLKKIGAIKNLRSIAFPENIGCGLAKGDWKMYKRRLEYFASENPMVDVYIVSQNPDPAKEGSKDEKKTRKDGDFPDIQIEFIKLLYGKLKKKKVSQISREEFEKEFQEYLSSAEQTPDEEDVSVTVDASADVEKYTWLSTTLEDYTEANIPTGWEPFFQPQLDVDYGSLHELSKYLSGEAHKSEIYPELENVYKAFSVPPEQIKVVIVGQDPYFGVGQATGVCFEVPEGIDPPPSLKNIYKELEDEGFSIENRASGDLSKWCSQGVLMINTALTVRAHEPASHSSKWLTNFTPALMRFLDEACQDLVVVLWGNHAQGFSKFFGERHKKIMSAHPSPLSSYRGFFGSKPFTKINHQLKLLGREEIDWNL